MESSDVSDPKTNPSKSETKSRAKSGHDLPEKSPTTYTSSILPQAMPTEGFSFPSGPYESGPSRGHSPYEYEYGQSSYAQAPSSEPMYPSYDISGTGTARRPSGGILPASSEAFASLGSGGAFSALPPLETSSYYPPSPVYGYGSSTPGYSSTGYQDPYSQPSRMGSGSPYEHSFAPGMTRESGYGMYPGAMPPYPYGQPYPGQFQQGRGFGPQPGRYGGQRRRQNTSYASLPGPPINPGGGAKGPDGANLFVFHIPNDFSNQEMYDLFSRYGNVLSARIMVEPETGRSRGFGFVSFDSPESSALAIKALNGLQIKGKRLKVQHKQIRGKESHNEPYSHYPSQSALPVPIQQYTRHEESFPAQGYNLPTHLLGDEGELSADSESKPAAQETLDSAKQYTSVLPPMPSQPLDDEDEGEEEHTGASSSPLDDVTGLCKALPDP